MSLPNTYTRLTYIQSSGTQYIDTQLKPNEIDKVTGKISYNSIPSGTSYIVGTRIGNESTAIGFALYNTSHNGFTQYDLQWNNYGQTLSANQIVDFESVIESGTQSFIVNGTQIYSNTRTLSISGDMYYFIFALHDAGANTPTYQSSARLFEMKMYKDNVLVRDFIPAKRNTGSVLGLYDLVNDVFYENRGTGAFIAGYEIKTSVNPSGSGSVAVTTSGNNFTLTATPNQNYSFTN